LAVSLTNLGTGYQKVREFERAEATMRRAVDILRALNRDHPTVTDYEDRLAASLTNLALSLAQLKRSGAADEANLEAIMVLQRLAREHPEVIRYQSVLGSAYGNEGNTWLGRKEFARALPWFEKSVATMDAILARQFNDVFARQVLRNSAWGQADSLVALGRPADSLPVWDQGIAAATGNAKLEMRLGRAATLAQLGSIDRALADAEAIQAEIGKEGNFLYAVAAKVPALAISTLREGQATQPGTPSADALGSLAVAWLRRAEVAGYFRENSRRVVQYREDPDLAVLRPRADFQILMRDLSFPTDPFKR
jgi:eukaryotic-like serine/threonine-protein kinase